MYITKIFLYASADRAVKHKRVLLAHRNVRKSALQLRIDDREQILHGKRKIDRRQPLRDVPAPRVSVMTVGNQGSSRRKRDLEINRAVVFVLKYRPQHIPLFEQEENLFLSCSRQKKKTILENQKANRCPHIPC